MSNEELSAARATAGATYASALSAFKNALVELAALDQVLSVPGFGHLPDAVSLRHSVYAPDFGPNLQTSVITRRDQIISRGL